MARLYQKNTEKQLIDVVNSRGNENKCGECDGGYPTWASWNLGLFLCGRCASVHRRILPPEISKVKSLTLDNWNPDQIDRLRKIGNKKAKKKWNPKRHPFPFDDDDVAEIEQFIRDKYIVGKFRDDAVDPDDYDKSSRYSDDFDTGRLRLNSGILRSRLRLNSVRTGVPRLSHRRLTQFESTQFPGQVGKLMGLGFTDKDLVREALILSNGDIDFALDILNEDSKINPNQNEIAPSLPKRPAASSGTSVTNTGSTSYLANNPMASMLQKPEPNTGGSNDWWSGSSNVSANVTGQVPQLQQQQPQQPQIYQYTDPVTGQISYVDSNGQQYLDPNNPQHQQMMQQQMNPQLVAQQTNRNQILSLYNNPDSFSTNVAAPVDPQQQQQQSNQPPQQSFPQQPTGMGFQQQQQPMDFQQPQATGMGFQQPQPTGMGFQQPQPTGMGFQQPQATGFGFQQQQSMGFQQQPNGFQQGGGFGQSPFQQQQQGYWQ